MGWDTEIVVLAENIESHEELLKIAEQIFKQDACNYEVSSCFKNNSNSLFFHYTRRKSIPYWTFLEISKSNLKVDFTVLASCPEFLSGPSGLIRISNGLVNDSYGIWGGSNTSIRESVISDPLNYIPLIHDWFGVNGLEQKERMKHVSQYPKNWCNGRFADNIVPILETNELRERMVEDYSNLKTYNWEEITDLSFS